MNDMEYAESDLEYAGFWVRVGASLIDTILMMVIVVPVLSMIYGKGYWASEAVFLGAWDLLFNYIFPAIVVIVFWIVKSATPGKILLDISIVDAKTGGKPSNGQLIGRYFAYYISVLPLMLGFIWVGFDKRKQGWHDKLAGTLVVKQG